VLQAESRVVVSVMLKDGYRCPMSYKSSVIKLLHGSHERVTQIRYNFRMRCDLHVHSYFSGPAQDAGMGAICRECYSRPEDLYATLKRRGMDLITLTDHDSIEGCEPLRRYADFFVSVEATCTMPSGTRIHVGVYDITERQHIEIQRRRNDLIGLLMYLTEHRLFFSLNHVFSILTGRREREDFEWFEEYFPAMETLNGLMAAENNRQAIRLARRTRKIALGGSDAHTLASAGSAYTEMAGAMSKDDFLRALTQGLGKPRGQSGGYWKLTRDVFLIAGEMMREARWKTILAPLGLLIPAYVFGNCIGETRFVRRWAARVIPSRRERMPFPGMAMESAME
jgi:predicted metal-dependent phosphoesterase TrpH